MAKNILIGSEEDDKLYLSDTVQSLLGRSFQYTVAQSPHEILQLCAVDNDFDLCVIDGALLCIGLEEYLQTIAKEKVVVVNVDGTLASKLRSLEIPYIDGYSEAHIKKMLPTMEKILKLTH